MESDGFNHPLNAGVQLRLEGLGAIYINEMCIHIKVLVTILILNQLGKK